MSNNLHQICRPIASWLFVCAFMVLAMAVIGAITRLTESGLSMVEWRPLIGTLPPLNEAEWERVFGLYQDSPEFQKKNSWMSLDEFKTIFFWEWFHRFWGRMIGIAYALPMVFFWLKGMIPRGYKSKLLIGLLLGSAQGLMGWYMVKSGLVDRPSVSHFRLAAHLSLAFIVYGYLLWLGFRLWGAPRNTGSFCLRRHGWTSLLFVSLTIIWGAFTAGLDGGLIYNSWPKMGDVWIPAEFENIKAALNAPAGVQFIHRWLALFSAALTLWFAARIKHLWLGGMVILQVGLGIATLLMQVPTHLAATHQAGAFVLAGILIFILQKIHKN